MLLMMPLDEWLMKSDFSHESPETQRGIEYILSWRSNYPIYETWLTEEDLPDDLLFHYQQFKVDYGRRWCEGSREWRSLLALHWESLIILPFASTAARIAAVFLRELAEKQWPRRVVRIQWLDIDIKANLMAETLIGSYAWSLWKIWRIHSNPDRALNVTACPQELAMASVLIASAVPDSTLVPIYFQSKELNLFLCLPGWELPFIDDQERQCLAYWLQERRPPQGVTQKFLSKWRNVVGINASTTTAIILREWLNYHQDKPREQDAISTD